MSMNIQYIGYTYIHTQCLVLVVFDMLVLRSVAHIMGPLTRNQLIFPVFGGVTVTLFLC